MQPVPYIGITGFTTNDEVRAVVSSLSPMQYPYLMVGILVSQKTMAGGTNKWPKRYPKRKNVGGIFEPHPQTINLVHYNTKEMDTLGQQMDEVDSVAGEACDGFQLNCAWPDPRILEEYLERQVARKRKRVIVLQCGSTALAQCDNDSEKVAQRIKTEYDGLVDYVLIDPSGGYGKEFSTGFAYEFLSALLPIRNIGAGIAGGFSSKNVAMRLMDVYHNLGGVQSFSIDAEGQLRDANDNLDIEECKTFARRARVCY